jgi:hypothetical protein
MFLPCLPSLQSPLLVVAAHRTRHITPNTGPHSTLLRLLSTRPRARPLTQWPTASAHVPLPLPPPWHHARCRPCAQECHSPYCLLNVATHGLPLSNFTAYNARWKMPSPESGGVLNMWFSYDLSRDVHVTTLDTSTDFEGAPEGETGDGHFPFLPAGSFAPNGTYLAWLEADLAAARARGVTWLIAVGHRPFEDFNSAAVVELFARYGVDLYLCGHGHSYARFDKSTYGDNATHIMVGGAGCDEMPYPSDQHAASVDEEAMTPLEACTAWCTRPEVRHAFASRGMTRAGAAPPPLTPATDPCHLCTAGGRAVGGPVYQSDNMAIGKLGITVGQFATSLTWQLLRAPDGKVLDSFTLNKPVA